MFKGIRDSLSRTRQSVFGQIVNNLGIGEITEETWEDLEALLIECRKRKLGREVKLSKHQVNAIKLILTDYQCFITLSLVICDS